MTTLLRTIVELSVLGSLITISILLVLKAVNKHLKESTKYILVLLATLTLIIPFNKMIPETKVSVSPKQHEIFERLAIPAFQETVQAEPSDIVSHEVIPETGSKLTYENVYWIVLFLLILRYVANYRKFTKVIKENLISVETQSAREIQALVGDEVRLVFSKQTSSPFVFGILKQYIVIPVSMMSESQLPLIIQHELIHYKRYDVLIKIILNIVHMVHWFNPLLFVFKAKAYQYMETSCDENVTDRLSYRGKINYAHLIIEVLDGYNVKESAVTTAFSSKQNKIKNRIEAFMNPKNINRIKKYSILSLVLLLTVSIGFLSKNKVVADSPKIKAASVSTKTTVKPDLPADPIDEPEDPETVSVDEPTEPQEQHDEQQETAVTEPDEPETVEQLFYRPVINGDIAFAFGEYAGHMGTDYRYNNGLGTGTGPVYAIGKGVVTKSNYDAEGWGYYVVVAHDNGYVSLYAHLEGPSESVGTEVDENTQLGTTGTTGRTTETQVHLEIRNPNNELIDSETILILR